MHFHKWPQWELSTSPAPHQCHDQPKHHSLLVTRRQKMARLTLCGSQFYNTSGTNPSIRHAGDSRNLSPLEVAEEQLGLFYHWCTSLIWEGKLCVYECACMHVMWLLHNHAIFFSPPSDCLFCTVSTANIQINIKEGLLTNISSVRDVEQNP